MIADFRSWVAGLPAAEGQIRRELHAGYSRILIDHPRSRNALSPSMMVALADALEGLPPLPLLLQGAEGTFCSGGNLEAVREHLGKPGSGRIFGGFMQATVRKLHHHPAPVIGILEGAALGGGAELLAACHWVVAHPQARIGFVQARLGVSPGFGGWRWLSERLGLPLAGAILEEARILLAQEAIGLVDQVEEAPLPAALRQLEGGLPARPSPQILPGPTAPLAPEVTEGIRRLQQLGSLPEDVALAEELAVFDQLWGGPAHRAALQEKRR